MARRASRDPGDLLRAHFSAEIAAARLEAPPPPKLEKGFRAEVADRGLDRRRGPSAESRLARPLELAAAAALILAFGLGIWAAPAETGLSRAMAANALAKGQALEVGVAFGRRVSAAIAAFARSAGDSPSASGDRGPTRFR